MTGSRPARTAPGAPAACALCGTPARPSFQAPPPELAPDLDLRPGEPTRSTLPRWIATCRGCGLSAPDLAEPPARARETMAGEAYRALSGPGPDRAFLRHAALCEAAGERAEAAGAVLQAAWVLDDAGRDATGLRSRAAALWDGAATMQDQLRRLDALRRAGEADAAAAQADALLREAALNETDRAVVEYQRGLAEAGDTGRHLMSSALRPPAQRPHVTHGRAIQEQAGGKVSLWRRLLGR